MPMLEKRNYLDEGGPSLPFKRLQHSSQGLNLTPSDCTTVSAGPNSNVSANTDADERSLSLFQGS
jgi:hypothetical protein